MINRISKTHIVLILILLLSLLLRVYKLDQVPPGFWYDEASYSYSAYSVLETGRDELGALLPLWFKNFGQYKDPLYLYLLIPLLKIMGLSVFITRFASVILGVLTTIAVYLLGKELFKNTKISLIASFLFAISPFALQFNRMQNENNLLVFLVTIASYYTLKEIRNKWFLVFGVILFSLTFYASLAGRFFVPLLLLIFICVYRNYIKGKRKTIVYSGLLMFVFLIPFIRYVVTPQAWPRVEQTSITSDIGITLDINKERLEHNSVNSLGRLYHNKVVGYGRVLLRNYLIHFSPEFLLFSGDPNKLYSTPNMGIMYVWELVMLLYGAHILLNRKNKKPAVLLILWLLLAFLPAAMTRFVPSGSRSFQAAPAIVLISAVGFYGIWKIIKTTRHIFPLAAVGVLFIIANFIYYLDNYYVHFPVRYAYAWRRGSEEVVDRVARLESNYEKVIVDQEGISYINFLFFLKYPPQLVQKEAKLTPPDEFGFSYIPKIGKYYFEKNPPQELEEGALYVGRKSWIGDRGEIIDVIDKADGDNAYYIIQK